VLAPTLDIFHVPVETLDGVWPEASKLLERAVNCSDGELDINQLRMLVTQGLGTLLVAERGGRLIGAAVIEFIQYPNYRVANVIAVGGRGLYFDGAATDRLAAWAKSRGATKLQAFCSPSRTRLFSRFGFSKRYDVVRRDL